MANLKACLNGKLSYYTAGSESSGLVRNLEELAKEYFAIGHAFAISSATAGLHIACQLIGESWEKTIYVPAVTFSATASSVLMAHKTPHFVDIEPDTYCINFSQIKPLIDHDSAIIAVHLHGHPANMGKAPNIPLIEDCAQAIGTEYHGKKVGTIGKVGIFSFNQGKQIQCGEGGLIITNDDELAHHIRLMSNHGEVISNILGYNYRMTELQAAVLIPQFKHLDEIINQRRELAQQLTEKLKQIEGVIPPIEREGCRHSYCTYPVRLADDIDRDELQAALLKRGVYFGKGGYKPLHLFDFYKNFRRYDLSVAEECYQNVMYTNIVRENITYKEVDRIAEILGSELRHQRNRGKR